MATGVLTRQCIGRRFESTAAMEAAIAAWQATRNEQALGAKWQFTTTNARVKLKSLHPMTDK